MVYEMASLQKRGFTPRDAILDDYAISKDDEVDEYFLLKKLPTVRLIILVVTILSCRPI